MILKAPIGDLQVLPWYDTLLESGTLTGDSSPYAVLILYTYSLPKAENELTLAFYECYVDAQANQESVVYLIAYV